MADAVDENRKQSDRTDARCLWFFIGFSFVLSECCAIPYRSTQNERDCRLCFVCFFVFPISRALYSLGRPKWHSEHFICVVNGECVVRHTVATIMFMLFCARCRISEFVYFMNRSEYIELNGLIDRKRVYFTFSSPSPPPNKYNRTKRVNWYAVHGYLWCTNVLVKVKASKIDDRNGVTCERNGNGQSGETTVRCMHFKMC